MSNNEQTLTTVENTQLAAYGEREVVRELVDRLLALHPAASEVGAAGMRAAAQLAVLIGASPLPALNEIHIYKDNKNNIHVEPGINYWQRRAEQKGGVRWTTQARPMNEQERRLYGIPDAQLAAICRGVRADEYHQCRQEGMNFGQADEACGVIGIGVVEKKEYAKNGRPLIWSAIKRAKADFYRQAFPIIPGETLPAGAGLRNVNNHYEPDFSSPQWGSERDREPLPAGAGIDWLRDNPTMVVDPETGEITEGVIEGELVDDEEPESQADAPPTGGPEWNAQITDLRASLEETESATIQAVCLAVAPAGLYGDIHHLMNAAKLWPEFEKLPAGTEIKPNMPLKQETALQLFDWLISRKQD